MNKLISEEIKYNGKIFKIIQRKYENKNKEIYFRDGVIKSNAVVIVARDNEDNIYFVKQNREIIGEETLELPAGLINENEDPMATALRELEEEVGVKATNIEFLGDYYSSSGFTNERVYAYYAYNLIAGEQHTDDDEEIIQVEKIKLDKCFEMLKNNEFKHASLNIALSLFYFQKIK